jgi:hypothetical protein
MPRPRWTRDARGVSGEMTTNVAFVTRLCRIVAAPAPAEERAACALALFESYKARLYARLEIAPTRRPSRRAKLHAEDALADLRHRVLKVEIGAPTSSAGLFASIRYRIEMARRALAIRIVDDEDGSDRSIATDRAAARVVALHPRLPVPAQYRAVATYEDQRLIETMRARLRVRRTVAASRDAVRQSHDLPACFDDPPMD